MKYSMYYISSLFRQCSAAHMTLITQQYRSRQTDTHTYESEEILHNYWHVSNFLSLFGFFAEVNLFTA